MRLGLMLIDYERTNQPKTNALMALMCFHASRFDARQTNDGTMILFEEQDESLWDSELINRGLHFLWLSAQGTEISSYHLEAKIACWHCTKEDTPEKWNDILNLYDQLMQINYSPSVALNRVFAFNKVYGATATLIEAQKLEKGNDHFYYLLLGELYKDLDRNMAKVNFEKAFSLAKTDTEKLEIQKKMTALDGV